MRKATVTRAGVLGLSLFSFVPAHGFQFWPTDAEWESWPGYCKARYAVTAEGRSTKFVSLVSESDRTDLTYWETGGVVGIHHFCAGAIWLQRARAQKDPIHRNGMLRNARNETEYAFSRSNKSSPLFVNITTQLATIMYEAEDYAGALGILQNVRELQPTNPVLYSAIAVMQRKLGHVVEAKETLLIGYRAVDRKSAEIAYNLGLLSIELGELDNAVKYAEEAYEMGFPLPGLRTKLHELGRM